MARPKGSKNALRTKKANIDYAAIVAEKTAAKEQIETEIAAPVSYTHLFDTQKIKKYTEQAKKEWGETPAYTEFEEKTAHKTCLLYTSLPEGAAIQTEQLRNPAASKHTLRGSFLLLPLSRK